MQKTLMRTIVGRLLLIAVCAGSFTAGGCNARASVATMLPVSAALSRTTSAATFGTAADAALATLEQKLYAPPGRWKMCVPEGCGSAVRDWGADALTYTLYLRWKAAGDASIPPIMAALAASSPAYTPCRHSSCTSWSDVPMWDAIAAARDYEVTGDRAALIKAQNAFAVVDRSAVFGRGACPAIDFQRPAGGTTALKTLETDSNYIKAALLLARLTGDRAYLGRAKAKYAAVRRWFLDPALPLYTTYVFDDGRHCGQVPGRFFASVNGNMIDSGLMLAERTGERRYLVEALATARAVVDKLSDDSGIYADLQAENDIAEPLIEAMYDLATRRVGFARTWLLTNATVTTPGPSGAYGRFFGGPAPTGTTSAWSANGGFALAVAAGALDGRGALAGTGIWQHAHFVADPVASAPATIGFDGRAIALIGTIGDVCCEPGHVRVFIDGRETVDTTGIWQNKSPAARALPNSVLLSWRWPRAGRHTITLEPGVFNAKEGGSSIHLTGYEVAP